MVEGGQQGPNRDPRRQGRPGRARHQGDDYNNPPHANCWTQQDTDAELEFDNNCDWFFRIFPAAYDLAIGEEGFGPDYGVMLESQVEMYFTYHIKAKAPPDFSALPTEG